MAYICQQSLIISFVFAHISDVDLDYMSGDVVGLYIIMLKTYFFLFAGAIIES